MSDDQPNHPTTVTRRIMITLSIILGSTLYSTTLLIASTLLPQTILFDVFPRRQHRMITSIYGMTVVIGPVIGPALGGYVSDMYSWRWAFYGLVPVGVASCIGLQLSMLRDPPRQTVRLDW